MKAIIKKLLTATLWVFPFSVLADSTNVLITNYPASSTVSSEVKTFARNTLVAGDISYQSDDEEGYMAEFTLGVEGYSKTVILDHDKTDSALHLFHEFKSRLTIEGFEQLYTCNKLDCGDLTGWQLYLSSQLLGDETSQHYILAKQYGTDGGEWYVQYYVIDLDGEPRSFIRTINTRQRPKLNIALNRQLLDPKNAHQELAELNHWPTFLFEFDSDQLNQNGKQYVQKLSDELSASSILRLKITGHADGVGDADYNHALALRRAHTVAESLRGNNALSGIEINIDSMGETEPVATNTTAEGRTANRRVSLSVAEAQDLSSQ